MLRLLLGLLPGLAVLLHMAGAPLQGMELCQCAGQTVHVASPMGACAALTPRRPLAKCCHADLVVAPATCCPAHAAGPSASPVAPEASSLQVDCTCATLGTGCPTCHAPHHHAHLRIEALTWHAPWPAARRLLAWASSVAWLPVHGPCLSNCTCSTRPPPDPAGLLAGWFAGLPPCQRALALLTASTVLLV